jgi:hypothetical protein
VHGAQELADRSRGAEIHEEDNAAAAVAGNGRAVETHEPPASASLVRGNGGEQAIGLLVLE